MDYDGGKRVFQRLGPPANNNNDNRNQDNRNQRVCYHWRAGKCSRFPCPFLHRELPMPPPQQQQHASNGMATTAKRSHGFSADDHQRSSTRRGGPQFSNSSTWGRGGRGIDNRVVKKMEKLCNFWLQGSCSYGDRCKYLHAWCTGCFSLLTQLEGHQKVVSGIAFPAGSDKLYTGSKDESVRVWDCQSGQCAGVINLGGEIGCMLSEGPWIFVGLPNLVKAWNSQTSADLSLSGPVGQVYALVVGNELLFAGTQDGSILAWKFNVATNCFEPAASLMGHTSPVVTLVVGANRLYSGSMDKTIRVWSLETLQCVQTLTEHTSVVMSLLCWDQFLISCSLDKTIKIWAATESGNLEVTYSHIVDYEKGWVFASYLHQIPIIHGYSNRATRGGVRLSITRGMDKGLLSLCGVFDLESKPVLLCSCNDNSVRAYDLPSFSERGKIFAKEEIRSIQIGPGHLFFTGDGTGEVRVWAWLAEPATSTP